MSQFIMMRADGIRATCMKCNKPDISVLPFGPSTARLVCYECALLDGPELLNERIKDLSEAIIQYKLLVRLTGSFPACDDPECICHLIGKLAEQIPDNISEGSTVRVVAAGVTRKQADGTVKDEALSPYAPPENKYGMN